MSEYPSGYRSQTSPIIPSKSPTPINSGILTSHLSQTDPAKWTYLKLIEYIFNFEKSLDDNHEIGARLVFFASEVAFYIQEVGYCGPLMISFSGCSENGDKLQLLQHVSQLNILLVAMEKRGEEPVRIGFKLKRTAEKEDRET